MRSEPAWLDVEQAIEFNRAIVTLTGEPHLVRDYGLLVSALARSKQKFAYDEDADLVDMAVAILFGIAHNHHFEQGNKRTAFVAAQRFLEINGYALDIPDTIVLADMIVQAIEGKSSALENAIADLFARGLIPI